MITTLETIFYPIEKIELPAVTLCPQGSVSEIMEAALYYQFEEWLIQKSDNGGIRKKRGTSYHIGNSSNLTTEQLSVLLTQFLNEIYPGAKDLPTKFAEVLSSDDPEQIMETKAILMPEEETKCDATDSLDLLNQLNQKMNKECPEPFTKIDSSTCIMLVDMEMTYDDASSYCRAQEGAAMHVIDSWEDIEKLENVMALGEHSFLSVFFLFFEKQ